MQGEENQGLGQRFCIHVRAAGRFDVDLSATLARPPEICAGQLPDMLGKGRFIYSRKVAIGSVWRPASTIQTQGEHVPPYAETQRGQRPSTTIGSGSRHAANRGSSNVSNSRFA